MTNSKQEGKVKTRRHRTAERKGSLELHNGKWRIVALVNGEKIRKSTGTANREEAERIQREFMAQFTARDAVAQQEKLAEAVKTAEARAEAAAKRAADALPALRIDEMADAFISDATRIAQRSTTRESDLIRRKHLNRFSRWVKEHYPECVEMRQFDENMAKEFLAELHTALAPSTYMAYLVTLKYSWKILGEQARCRDNPWEKFKAATVQHVRRENFTPEQIEAIFSKLKPGTELHALCTIGRYTGLRLGDAATLKWSAIDMAGNMIELLPRKVKRFGVSVRIPIHETLRSVLLAMPKNGEYVMPKTANLYLKYSQDVSVQITKLLQSAGIETSMSVEGYAKRIPRYGFHSFRHSFVSTCAEQGIPLSVVQELVGHLSQDMTQHYFHLSDETARKAIAMLPGAGVATATPTAKVETSKVSAAVYALEGLTKDELRAVREKLDTLLAG